MPWPTTPATPAHRASYKDAEPRAFWLREPAGATPALTEQTTADLCIVGAGFTGLWAALHAAEQGRDVVVLEGETAGFGASGRNGGFAVASLTHGIENGLARFKDEMPTLERLALENFQGIQDDLARYGIDCDFEVTGELLALTDEYQLPWLEEEAQSLTRFGHEVTLFDKTEMQAQVNSPTYIGGVWDHTGAGILDPGKLADGLKAAALRKGVRIYEHSPVEHITDDLTVLTSQGRVKAAKVLLATSAYPPLINAIKRYIVPVYDYALMTEPIDMGKVGWANRQGIGDGGNQFHYYRPTKDGRILYGGWDAVYRYRGPVSARHDEHDPTFAKLAQHFFHTFPQLEGTRFTHRWGGAIDTSSRFSVFFGTSHGGRLAYATGYTGLGVAATRFGGRTAVDLLDGKDTEATRTRYVRTKPVPFPSEPLRYGVVQLTRNRLAAADRNAGQRGLWLRTLDRLGLGFDS